MVEDTTALLAYRAHAWRAAKSEGRRLATLTAYDYPTAKLVAEAGIDMILVGDSLGMVVLGYPDTTQVTMADMLHHLRAVKRGAPEAFVAVDLPYASYETANAAVAHAGELIEAGAQAVKMEGGATIESQLRAVAAAGFPLIGHLGMLPQSIHSEGGHYRRHGRTAEEAIQLSNDAQLLEDLGAMAIVLECVEAPVATAISAALEIPTIGIGSGSGCDGEILVIHDLIGFFPWFTPKFVTPDADVAGEIRNAVARYIATTQTPSL